MSWQNKLKIFLAKDRYNWPPMQAQSSPVMAADCDGVDGEVLLLSQCLNLCQYPTVAGVTSPISDQIQTHSICKATACLEQRCMTHSHTYKHKKN